MHATNRSLEGLRGAAALLVVLFHMEVLSPFSGSVRNGYLSVDLFFVLSGVVISSAYGTQLTNAANVAWFILRRFGRLWPLHIVTTILFLALVNLHPLLTHLIQFVSHWYRAA